MAEAVDPDAEKAPKKSLMLPLVAGLFLSLALGGGGFYAVYSGLLGGSGGGDTDTSADSGGQGGGHAALPDIAFVPIDPMVVSLAGSGRHLRFQAQLEVAMGEEGTVSSMMPRILDVINGYLRAVTVEDIEKPTALLMLRAQLLRRVQLVVGETRVNDLLVTEFVLN